MRQSDWLTYRSLSAIKVRVSWLEVIFSSFLRIFGARFGNLSYLINDSIAIKSLKLLKKVIIFTNHARSFTCHSAAIQSTA